MNSNKYHPPQRAERLLQWFVRDELAEEVLGDLEEKFYVELEKRSPAKAKFNYWYQVFNYLRPFALRKSQLTYFYSYAMYKNYTKVAWRNLFKYKMYSSIKIGGFALGIAACLLIALYVQDELSFDKHYENKDRIFRLMNTYNLDSKLQKWTAFAAPIADVLEEEFPEVKKAGRFIPYDWYDAGNNQLRREDQTENTYEEGFAYADQDLIEILEIPMVEGNRSDALAEPNTILISERIAKKYFPNEDALDKTFLINDNESNPYKVGGVMENFPANSHLQFDFLITLSGVEFWKGEQSSWCCSNYNAYILLKDKANLEELEEKLTVIKDNHMIPYLERNEPLDVEDAKANHGFELQSVQDIYLNSDVNTAKMPNGDIRFVWMFGAIAVFILLLACINFINLSTAKSANRAKEVGLRKVVGSHRGSLIRQFLTESVLFSFISFVLGVFLTELLLPFFNNLAGKSMSMPWEQPFLIPLLLGSAIFVGILAGLYPSFYLSSFQPVDVLKGHLSKGSKGSGLRSTLVVFQFTTSIALIIGAFIVHRQMDFILNRELGFEKDQVVMLQGTTTLGDKYPELKRELERISSIDNVSISNYMPVEGTKRDQNGFWKEGRVDLDKSVGAQIWRVDDDYINTLGIKLIDGRNFNKEMTSDSTAVIINRSMAEKFGFETANNQQVTNGFEAPYHVIGIVEDFHFNSIKQEIRPLALAFGSYGSIVPIKINSADMPASIASITKVWNEFMPNQPMRYSFLDEKYAMMYEDVQRTGKVFTIFAFLAIVVACLGLFALSAFMVEQRRKEISIRKVLGASFVSLFNILTADFLKLVLISLVIAIPLSWYGMQRWLEDYSYRVEITWDVFFIAGLITVGIAVLTISYESIKVASMNPAGNLRSE